MASSGARTHNPATCPEQIKKNNAELKAAQVLSHVETIPKQDRGRTPYVDYEVDDLPKSAELFRNPAADSDTFFDSAFQAETYRELLLTKKTPIDATIPIDPRDIKAHVKALFAAFKCVPDECEDTEKITKSYSEGGHDNALTEALCWQLVEGLIRRSKVSTNLVESFEPDKYKFRKCADKNFSERFDLLVAGMAKSKSLCKHLNDAPFMYKVLDDPLTNVERIESNRKLNGQKAQVMKRGKEAVAAESEEGKKKKQKTEDTKEESALIKTESARRLRGAAASASTSARTSNFATPQAGMHQPQYPFSAPANYGLLPQNRQTFSNGHLMQYHGSGYFNTPTRGNASQSMDVQGMLGSGHQDTYFGHALPPQLMRYGAIPPPQFGPLPAPSHVRGHQFGAAAIPRTASRASDYPELTAPMNQATTNWMPQPQRDRLGSDDNSGGSTITAPELENADDAAADPFTFGQDNTTNANPSYEQTDMNTLIQEAEDENDESELTEWDDAALEHE